MEISRASIDLTFSGTCKRFATMGTSLAYSPVLDTIHSCQITPSWIGEVTPNAPISDIPHHMTEHRKQSSGEELANTISHGLALLLVVAAVPVLIASAVKHGGIGEIVGAGVFSFTMVLLYLTSSIYHALPASRVKRIFKILDHSAIYLLIAGSYTPFTLGVLRGTLGWVLFGLVWGLALFGIVWKATGILRNSKLSSALYAAMGWLVVIGIKPLWMGLPTWGFCWLVAGGISYTAGIGFYAAHGMRYAHFIWHLFVMAGTACHVVAVLSANG